MLQLACTHVSVYTGLSIIVPFTSHSQKVIVKKFLKDSKRSAVTFVKACVHKLECDCYTDMSMLQYKTDCVIVINFASNCLRFFICIFHLCHEQM